MVNAILLRKGPKIAFTKRQVALKEFLDPR
jgi:hypothetical protein